MILKASVLQLLPDLPHIDSYNPEGLPLPDGHPDNHPKFIELRDLAAWAEGMVWTSPERRCRTLPIGAMNARHSAEFFR